MNFFNISFSPTGPCQRTMRLLMLALICCSSITQLLANPLPMTCEARSMNQNNWISNVVSKSMTQTYYSNPSGASSYSDYTSPCIPYDYGINSIVLGITASTSGQYLGIYIDANNDGLFDQSECENPFLANQSPMSGTTINLALSPGFTGNLGLRIILSADPILDPCVNFATGEVEDYTICFSESCNSSSTNQTTWISNVESKTGLQTFYANPTGASPYSDYTSPCIPYDYSENNIVLGITASTSGQFLGIYVDANNDGVFDQSECENPYLANVSPMGGTTINIALSPGYTGTLALRLILSADPIFDPCDDINTGEVEDYTICFSESCNSSSTNQTTWISNVESKTMGQTFYANPTGASPYSDYSSPCIPYDYGENNIVLGITASTAGQFLGIYVDANNDGVFDQSECENPYLANVSPMGGTTINIALSPGYTGTLALRLILSADPIFDPCDDINTGEVEDYTICFSESCNSSSTNQTTWISNVESKTGLQTFYANPTGASPYSDYTSPCIPYDYSENNIVLGITASTSGQFLGIYVDANNDGVFDQSECENPYLANVSPMSGTTINIALSPGYTGQLALRLILSADPIFDPCGEVAIGEVEDYTICFSDGCQPESEEHSVWIGNVRSRTPWQTFYSNPTGSGSYTDYSNPCIPYDYNENGIVLSINASSAGNHLGVYIDLNDDGVFDANELITPSLATNSTMTGTGVNIALPLSLTGTLAMRIILSTEPITGPCDDIASGEIEDYTICFSDGCQPESEDHSVWISNVRSRTSGQTFYSNPTGSGSYTDYSNPCIPYDYNESGIVLSINASSAGNHLGLYIDLNNDGVYDANELITPSLATNSTMTGTGVNIALPLSLTGTLATRIILSPAPITGPCDDIGSGEIEDYTICFDDSGEKGDGGRGRRVAQITSQEVTATLFPNPASTQSSLRLELPADEVVSVQVMDMQGKVVAMPTPSTAMLAGPHELAIATDQLGKGLYIVVVKTSSEIKSLKLIVQ